MNKNMRILLAALCCLGIADTSCTAKAVEVTSAIERTPQLYTLTNDQQNQINALDNQLNPLWNQLSPLQQQKYAMQQKMLDQMFRKQSPDYEKLANKINSLVEQQINPLRLKAAQIILAAIQSALRNFDPSSQQYKYLNAQIQGQKQYIQTLQSPDAAYLLYSYGY